MKAPTPTDLTREQIMAVVDEARQKRSLATGDVTAASIREAAGWLARTGDRLLHALLMSPTARR